MRYGLAIAILLLLFSSVVGCQAVPNIGAETNESLQAGASTSSHQSLIPSEDSDTVAPAEFEPPEPMPVPAEDVAIAQQPMSLTELEAIAFQNNPTLAAAAAHTEIARGKQVQAGLYPNPVAGYHATEIGNVGTAGQQGGFISQRFITGGKLGLDRAIAGKQIDEAHFRFHAQQQRVLSDVRMRFYDALVAQQRVDLTQQLARIGDELVVATKKLVESRLGSENDLLQAEIKADESQILLDNARNLHVEAWRRLSAVIGTPAMPVSPLSGDIVSDLPSFQWDNCYAAVVSGNPELSAAQARVERTRIAIVRASKEPIPNVDVSVSVRHHNVTDSDVVNVQAGIPIPIFNKNQGNIRAAEAEWIAANQEFQRIELDLQDRLAVAYRRYANGRQQVERYGERIVPRAKQSLTLVTDGYQKGQVTYLTLLTAQQTYHQVNLSYLDSLRELWAAAAAIDGQLLSGSLAAGRSP